MPIHIRVKVYEEIKVFYPFSLRKDQEVEWQDNNGLNTPYVVTYI